MDYGGIDLLKLQIGCQDRQADNSHEGYCLEIFRRAIEENDNAAWTLLYRLYHGLVRQWIIKSEPPESADFEELIQETFFAFHRFYTADKFARAIRFASVLSYLRNCAGDRVRMYRRYLKSRPDEFSTSNLSKAQGEVEQRPNEKRMGQQELWEVVLSCCRDATEQLLAKLSFQYVMSPKEICEMYPDQFPTTSDVNRIKRNLLNRLRRHPKIKSMYE